MDTQGSNAVRHQIGMILSRGIGTEAFPRADTHEAMQDIVRRLRENGGSLKAKIVIGGFTIVTIMQVCKTCMYYLHHRRHCDLPALDVPVEPEWSCRLWRI